MPIMPTSKQIEEHLESVLPRTCSMLAARLREWLDVSVTSHSEAAILASDGSLNDEAYALIQFARVFIEQVNLHAGETANLILLQARVGIMRHVMAAISNDAPKKEGE